MERKILIIQPKHQDSNIFKLLNAANINYEITTDIYSVDTRLLADPLAFDALFLSIELNYDLSIKLIRKVNAHSDLKLLPIIVESASEHMANYLKSGARYCFPIEDLYNEQSARAVIEAAMRDRDKYLHFSETQNLLITSMMLIKNAHIAFRSLTEAHAAAGMIAEACPNPKLAIVGISEIFINAIEHGNLNINYDDKTKLHSKDMWFKEIERLNNLPENANKYVDVYFSREQDFIKITVEDRGSGFDWKNFETLDLKRAFDTHGRGIVMAKNLTFERLEYHGCGNKVDCFIALS